MRFSGIPLSRLVSSKYNLEFSVQKLMGDESWEEAGIAELTITLEVQREQSVPPND